MARCTRCGAELLGGEPMHELTVYDHRNRAEIQAYCLPCIDEYSSACWNDEEWGPYPSRLQHRNTEGRA